jgi:hypothetical protein
MATDTGTGTEVAAPGESVARVKQLGAADFRAAKEKPRRVEPVEVPDLGGTVYVRALTALEKDRLDDVLTDDRGRPIADNVRAKVVAMCACDAAGKALFAFTPAEVAEIGSWPLAVVGPVYDAAMQINRPRAGSRAAEKKD